MLRNRSCVFAVAALLTLPAWLLASALGQATRLSQVLAPATSEQTLAVLRIDTTRIDADALFDMIVDTASTTMNPKQVEEIKALTQRARQNFKQRFAELKAAGGDVFYLVLSADEEPVLVLPVTAELRQGPAADWIEGTLEDARLSHSKQIRKDTIILAGLPRTIDRLQGRAPTVRPELDKAAAQVPPAAIQLFLIPSADSRRVLEAMLPVMGDQQITVPTGALTDGLQWAALSISLPPKPSLTVHVDSANAASASALRKLITSVWAYVGRVPQFKEAYPNLDASLTMLTPATEGSALQLAVNQRQFTQLAGNLVTPGLFVLRESMLRLSCGTTLSGMGKAILIYANDYDDKFPPSLETLVEDAEYPRSGLVCPAMKDKPGYESYIYRGVDLGSTSANPDLIMVHDRAGNHPDGRNVLFLDSRVEWVPEQQFQELIERDNRLRRTGGFKEKPAE